jgi:hypothetical protein
MAKPLSWVWTASPISTAALGQAQWRGPALAFDVLAIGGDDLRDLPLSMRKTNLERLLRGRPDGISVNPFEIGAIGPDLFHAACSMGLEGLVSKRSDRPYRSQWPPTETALFAAPVLIVGMQGGSFRLKVQPQTPISQKEHKAASKIGCTQVVYHEYRGALVHRFGDAEFVGSDRYNNLVELFADLKRLSDEAS